jgi:hypothetical protein
MNQIKIIKRANLQSPSERNEAETKKAEPAAVIKRQAVKVIGNWVDEWRGRKMPDARRAFDELFASAPGTA